MLDKSLDVVAVMLVTVVAMVLALLGLRDGVLLFVLGVPLAVFFPGYAVIAWWAQGAFPRPTRVVLSVGLSVGLATICGWILGLTPWGLQLQWWALAMGSITLGAGAAALRRRTVVFVYAASHPPTLRHPLVLAAGSGVALAAIGTVLAGTSGRSSAATLPVEQIPAAHLSASTLALRDVLRGMGSALVAQAPTPSTPPAARIPRAAAPARPAPVAQRMPVSLRDWPTRQTNTASQSYADNQYRIALSGQPSIGVSSRLLADAYRLNIDITIEQGAAGLVFLAAEPTVFYRILFDAERGYAIQQLQPTTDPATLPADWTPSAAINTMPLRVRVERHGATLQFFANNEALTTFTVPDGNVTNQVGVALADASGQGQATFANLVVERMSDAP